MKIGIDIGSTNATVASLNDEDIAVLIKDNNSKSAFTPVRIYIDNRFAFVGQLVKTLQFKDPSLNVLSNIIEKLGSDEVLYKDLSNTEWYPESVAALLIKKLKMDAEVFHAGDISGAVLAIPPDFTQEQKDALKRACQMCEVEVLSLLESPMAAMLGYGLANQVSGLEYNLVVNLGGNHCFLSVIEAKGNTQEIIANHSVDGLGGDLFDRKLIQIINNQYEEGTGNAPKATKKNFLILKKLAEKIKIRLSSPFLTFVEEICTVDNQSVQILITKAEFDESIGEEIDRLLRGIQECLMLANIGSANIRNILLVGGSTLIPSVKKAIEDLFNEDNQTIFNEDPREVIAKGAALHAYQISGEIEDFSFQDELPDVANFNLAFKFINQKTGEESFQPIIQATTPLPTTINRVFQTAVIGQRHLSIDLIEYQSQLQDGNLRGKLDINLPWHDDSSQIEVILNVNSAGKLNFDVRDLSNNQKIPAVFNALTKNISPKKIKVRRRPIAGDGNPSQSIIVKPGFSKHKDIQKIKTRNNSKPVVKVKATNWNQAISVKSSSKKIQVMGVSRSSNIPDQSDLVKITIINNVV